MKLNVILQMLRERKINSEEALETLAKIDCSPGLFNDHNGHWAVAFSGFQEIPFSSDPESISVSIFIEKECWYPSIREALIYAIENNLLDNQFE
jgi:hypothetical protein